MANLKDFVISLAKKALFDPEGQAVKPFFDSLPDVEVPDAVIKGIDNSLISLSEAKNNFADIKNHYTKQALDGVDTELMKLIEDFQVDDATKTEILAENSTYKKVPNLFRKIVELDRKKNATTGGKDKAEIQKQIDDLHAQLKSEKEARENEKKNFDQQRLQDRINSRKNVLFNGVKTIHDELDPEIRYNILDVLLNKELQDKGAKLAFDDQDNFIIIRNDGTNFFGENHQQVKPMQFIEQSLAKNKQLKVTDPPNGSNGATNKNGVNQPNGSSGNNGNAKDGIQNGVIDRNKQALADYEASQKNGAFGMAQ